MKRDEMRKISNYCHAGLFIGILLLLGCSLAQSDSGKMQSLSPRESSSLLSEKKAIIVDVREDSEWHEQHIPGAVHVPLGQLLERLTELKDYKNRPIITQCRSGARSLQAQEILKSAGFTQVYNMSGGILAWQKDGLTTE